MPKRIQRKRVAGWRLPEGAVVVSRPAKWGNPFVVSPGPVIPPPRVRMWDVRLEGELLCRWDTRALARADAVNRFRGYLGERRRYPGSFRPLGYPWDTEIRAELAGKDLACWCPLPAPGEPDVCHAVVLLELANGGGP